MKIAYLLGSLNRGGTETLLLDVFRNARKQGLDAIGIYRKTGVLESDFLQSGVEMKHLNSGRNILVYLWRLRLFLKQSGVEIAHAQQALDGLYAWLACLGTDIKVVLTFHGYDFTEGSLGARILQFIIKKTDVNCYVSDTQRQYYQQKYKLNPEKQVVVYNGISFDKLDGTPGTHQMTLSHQMSGNATRSAALSRTPGKLRAELNLSASTLLLGAVGNFNDVRDQLTTCRFLKLLKELQVDFHFVFVGKRIESSPQFYDECFSFCQSAGLSTSVTFIGVRNDVPHILNELDAFVYSTDHDTFGIAVVEAMAVGVPVFVNDWGVMSEITENGKYASLYKTKDENDLLRKFMLFLQNKVEYQTAAKEAALFVRKRYSIEKHIEELKRVYN